jgi:hypothetical protein
VALNQKAVSAAVSMVLEQTVPRLLVLSLVVLGLFLMQDLHAAVDVAASVIVMVMVQVAVVAVTMAAALVTRPAV